MTNAVIYCRVSSQRQVTEGHGLDSQEHRCRERARMKGYSVIKAFRESGISGSIAQRPAILEMFNFLDDYPGCIVLIDDLSRLDRDMQVHTVLRGTLREKKAKLECLNMDLDDENEVSEAMENIAVVFNQLHRKVNRKTVVNRQRARIESGFWPFCLPPGLKFETKLLEGRMQKVPVCVSPLAEIYKEAIEGYETGKYLTLQEVRQFILGKYVAHGVARKLSLRGTKEILSEILYTGWLEYMPWEIGLRKGKWNGFVSLETYNKVGDILAGKTRPRLRNDYKLDFPLRGLMECSWCDRLLTGSWSTGKQKKRYPSYSCKTLGCPYRYKSLPRPQVDSDFATLLGSLTPDPTIVDLAKEVLADVFSQKKVENDNIRTQNRIQVQNIQNEISSLLSRVSRINDDNVAGLYEERLASLALNKAQLEAELFQSESPVDFSVALKFVCDVISQPRKLWESNDYLARRAIVSMYFSEHLSYDYELGFRTPKFHLVIDLISNSERKKDSMVEMEGVEPSCV